MRLFWAYLDILNMIHILTTRTEFQKQTQNAGLSLDMREIHMISK